jgi:hypothetical protein
VDSNSEQFALKVPLQLKCSKCMSPASVKIHLDATSVEWTCENCGSENSGFFDPDVTIGVLLLERSGHEIRTERDYSMGIVMAAMALDTELSRLFGKWKEIDAIKAGLHFDREECEKELRNFRTIDQKIEAVSYLLVRKGIDEFVSTRPKLADVISTGSKSIRLGSLAKDFREHLFWPRNKILHWGDVRHSSEDAARCYSLADCGLRILREMDHERREYLS